MIAHNGEINTLRGNYNDARGVKKELVTASWRRSGKNLATDLSQSIRYRVVITRLNCW